MSLNTRSSGIKPLKSDMARGDLFNVTIHRIPAHVSSFNAERVYHTSACPLCKSESLITDTESGEVICGFSRGRKGRVTSDLYERQRVNEAPAICV